MKKLQAIFWLILFMLLAMVFEVVSLAIMPVAVVCALFARGGVKQWGINCFEGLDNYRSAQTGGDPDEAISSRLGKARARQARGWSYIADKVDLVAKELFNDLNHSNKSIEHDEGKKQVTKY